MLGVRSVIITGNCWQLLGTHRSTSFAMALAVRPPVQRAPLRDRCTLRCTASAAPGPSRRDTLLAGGALLGANLLGANPASAATSAFDFQVMQYDKALSMATFTNQVVVLAVMQCSKPPPWWLP